MNNRDNEQYLYSICYTLWIVIIVTFLLCKRFNVHIIVTFLLYNCFKYIIYIYYEYINVAGRNKIAWKCSWWK